MYEKSWQYVLQACIMESPDFAALKGFATLVREAQRESCTDKQILNRLLAALLTGTRYGNWPSA